MGTPTGRLMMRYATNGAAYDLTVPLAPISLVPVGANNDYLYTGDGPKQPVESGVLATFAAFAGLWAPYYDATWALTLLNVNMNTGTDVPFVPVVPNAPTYLGTGSTPSAPDKPLLRAFTFRSPLGAVQRVRLFQVGATETNTARTVTASSGGFDDRDRMLVGYLSGLDTGLVCWDGQPFPPSARAWMKLQALAQSTAATQVVGDYLVSG